MDETLNEELESPSLVRKDTPIPPSEDKKSQSDEQSERMKERRKEIDALKKPLKELTKPTS
jgi:hypothetical protein